jgi:hypothetical protein
VSGAILAHRTYVEHGHCTSPEPSKQLVTSHDLEILDRAEIGTGQAAEIVTVCCSHLS